MAELKKDPPEIDGPCRHEDCDGLYKLTREGDCACHITPPCSACMDAPLICRVCNDEVRVDDEDET